jgi:hypothetical protein
VSLKSDAVLTIVERLSLIAAAVVAFSAMVHGAGVFAFNLFYPWVIGPYIFFLVLFALPWGKGRGRTLAGCITALLLFLFTCFFYIDAMWIHVSSTSALIFIIAPAYLLVGGLVTYGLACFFFTRTRQ